MAAAPLRWALLPLHAFLLHAALCTLHSALCTLHSLPAVHVLQVGSVAVEAAEVKAVSHEYSAEGSLRAVSFRKVTARE